MQKKQTEYLVSQDCQKKRVRRPIITPLLRVILRRRFLVYFNAIILRKKYVFICLFCDSLQGEGVDVGLSVSVRMSLDIGSL